MNKPGFYDCPKTNRRYMFVLAPDNKTMLCFGWCHASVLTSASEYWEPNTVFGTYKEN